MNTLLQNKNTIIIPSHQKQIIFHDASKTTEYIVEENAELNLFDIVVGEKEYKSTAHIILKGKNASVQLYGMFFASTDEVFEMNHLVEHQASHTTSKIMTRGALGGKAKASYTGRILIAKGMAGCSGNQEARTLLLSRDAHVDMVPHLEIGNNDVQCSHSVSVSYIDELKKFYLESRGVGESDVVQTIVSGHFDEMIQRIPDKKRQKKFVTAIEQYVKV